jgi:hypothetical protein
VGHRWQGDGDEERPPREAVLDRHCTGDEHGVRKVRGGDELRVDGGNCGVVSCARLAD